VQARVLGVRRLAATAGLMHQMEVGITREIPPEFTDASRAISLSSRHKRAVVRETLFMARSHGQPPDLGFLPLTVLTATGRNPTWTRMQRDLTALSTASTHITATRAGHSIQADEPELVIHAIRDLVARASKPAAACAPAD
jgi:hypothetical protein